LSAFVVAARADGAEVDRITDAPKALAAGLNRQRRLAKSLSRKQKGSHNRRDATAKLGRHHHHMANIRRHFLHQVARAISDASWAEFARLLKYKQTWRGGVVLEADRWYPSTRLCPVCGVVNVDMTLADRVFTCGCGHCADRDTNAAVNLARWAQTHPAKTSPDPRTPKQQGRATNARRRDGADQHPTCAGETSPKDAGTDVHTAPAA
jgi:putative transposase